MPSPTLYSGIRPPMDILKALNVSCDLLSLQRYQASDILDETSLHCLQVYDFIENVANAPLSRSVSRVRDLIEDQVIQRPGGLWPNFSASALGTITSPS